jgi:RNA polymerase sigma-70 factor, ECF subfamily
MSASIDLTIKAQHQTSSSKIEGYEQIVEIALPSLLRLARRLTWPDTDLSADIVQDAVVKGFQALKKDKLELTPKTPAWLKQAVYLEFLLHKRSSKRVAYTASQILDSHQSHNPQPFANDLNPTILKALNDLPEEQRELVILVDLEELEYQEVSDFLQIPIGTVRSRLSRARWKLANQLHHLSGERS